MPTTLQFRRGNNTQNNSFTGAAGEITFDTTNKTLRVHDASTAGGTRLATFAEVQALQAANALDSDIIKAITNNELKLLDSARATSLIDSAYVQARVTAGTDSSATIALIDEHALDSGRATSLIDSAYINARTDANIDSSALITLVENELKLLDSNRGNALIDTRVNASFINNLTIDADTLGGQNSAFYRAYGNLTGTPTIPSLGNSFVDSAEALKIVDANALDSGRGAALIDARVNATFINNLTIDADTLGGQNSAYHLNYNNFTNTPTIPGFGTNFIDSSTANTLADARIAANLIDEDNFASNSNSRAPSQQSVKAFIDTYVGELIDEDNMGSNSASRPPSQQSVKAYVDAEVAGVVDAAPGALNTLNELAAALNDDANFSTTVTNSIATKATLAEAQAVDPKLGTDFVDSAETLKLIDANALDSARGRAFIQGSDLDMGTNKILYANVYANLNDLPNASTYHGMFAHVHATGYAYFSHAGAWYQLIDTTSVPKLGSDFIDSAEALKLIDANALDSGRGNALIDARVNSTFINNLTIDADTLGGQNSAYYRAYSNLTGTPTIPSLGNNFVDSAATITLADARIANNIIDEDNFSTNSSTRAPSQQSVKAYVDANAGSTLTVQEEGSSLSTAATTLNFVGSNVTASGTGSTKTITITGSGGIALSDLSVTTTSASGGGSLSYDNSTGVFTFAPSTNTGGGGGDVVDDTSPQLGGDLETNGNNINVADTDLLQIGTGNDLQIYHQSDVSYLKSTNASAPIRLQAPAGEIMGNFAPNGSVDLYHNGSKKFETTSAGATVTGALTVSGDLTVDTNTLSIDASTNHVGIGISPQAAATLSIVEDVGTADQSQLMLGNANGSFMRLGITGTGANENAHIKTNANEDLEFQIGQAANNASPNFLFSTSGNFSLTGTVDGRDVAADGTKLDGIASGATANANTDALSEGSSNLYFTNTRALDLINANALDSARALLVAETEFSVTTANGGAYKFTGDGFPSESGNNPTLYFTRGKRYVIHNSSYGAHPLYIKTTPGTGTGNQYASGTAGQGTVKVTFDVPMDAPTTLYYQCSVHSAMRGSIVVLSDASAVDSAQVTGIVDSDYVNIRSLKGLSVTTASASGGGSLAYNNVTGVFTFAPSTNSGGGGGGGLDSALAIQLIDSDYVRARQSGTSGTTAYSPAPKYARLGLTSNKSVSTSFTAINTFDTRIVDTSDNNALTSTLGDGKFIIPAGVSKIKLRASAIVTDVGDQVIMQFWKNGSEVAGTSSAEVQSTGVDQPMAMSAILDVVQNDYFQVAIYAGDAGTVSTTAQNRTWFELEVVEGSMLGGFGELSTLSNVQSTTPSDGQALVWDSANQYWEPGTVGAAITVQEEGSSLSTSATTLNFVGSGVTASGTGATKTITISGGGGGGSGGSGLTKHTYFATAGQTQFSGADELGTSLAFDAGTINVYHNGIQLRAVDDYIESAGTNRITFTQSVDSDDIVVIDKFSGGGGGTSWQSLKTSSYTAEAGQGVLTNTTGGAFAVNLPANPSAGDEVKVVDAYGIAGTNNVTIGRNNSKIHGADSDFILDINRAAVSLVYVDGTQGWVVTEK